MKRIALLTALSLVCAAAFAQTPGTTQGAISAPPVAKTGKRTINVKQIEEKVLIDLNLTGAQVLKIKDLEEDLRAKRKALHKANKGFGKGSPEAKDQMKELNARRKAGMQAILGPTLYKTYEKMHDAVKAARAKANDSKATP